MPRPVASSVTNVRSEGMSAVGATPLRVGPEPLPRLGAEQLDGVEDRTPDTGDGLERGVPRAPPHRRVGGEQDEREAWPALVQDGGLAQRLPQAIGAPEARDGRA